MARKSRFKVLLGALEVLGLCAVTALPAFADPLSNHPLALAIRNGNCVAAVKFLNPDATLNDKDTAFMGGRMLSEGICVEQNPIGAAHFFAHAADLGDRESKLELSTSVGQGEGSEQSYERASARAVASE